MNRQEVFDIVVAHARKQQKVAINNDNTCGYRTPDGLKCFIGCLIPDDLYKKGIEGLSVTGIGNLLLGEYTTHETYREKIALSIFSKIPMLNNITKEDIYFLETLQKIHDTHPVPEWESTFQLVADSYNLEYTAPCNDQ